MRAVAGELGRSIGVEHVEAAFLELGVPDLGRAVDRLVGAGVDSIAVIPYFLTLGLHMERDLPPLIERISKKYKGLRIAPADPLDGHPGLVQALADRAMSAFRSLKP